MVKPYLVHTLLMTSPNFFPWNSNLKHLINNIHNQGKLEMVVLWRKLTGDVENSKTWRWIGDYSEENQWLGFFIWKTQNGWYNLWSDSYNLYMPKIQLLPDWTAENQPNHRLQLLLMCFFKKDAFQTICFWKFHHRKMGDKLPNSCWFIFSKIRWIPKNTNHLLLKISIGGNKQSNSCWCTFFKKKR